MIKTSNPPVKDSPIAGRIIIIKRIKKHPNAREPFNSFLGLLTLFSMSLSYQIIDVVTLYLICFYSSNLTIKDRKLCVGKNPFYLIERGRDEVNAILEKFEPEKRIDLTIDSPVFTSVSSTWLSMSVKNQTASPG
jgi:hypothetical protein